MEEWKRIVKLNGKKMYYINNIKNYLINTDSNISDILKKHQANEIKFICVINSSKQLVGIISLGDIVNALDENGDIKNILASEIMNSTFSYAKLNDKKNTLIHLLEKHKFVPVLDRDKKVKLIIVGDPEKREFVIGNHEIKNQEDYILIAEIGNNHNGDLERAFDLIRAAKINGADIAKFQMRDLNSLYGDDSISHDLSTEYVINLLKKVSFSNEDMYKCFDFCKKVGITPLCTPFDLISLEKLEQYGLEGYKVASADLTNHELLLALIETKKPLIISTGMSNDEDIDAAISLLEENYVNYVLCHTNSTYPTPFSDVHLNYINNLKRRTQSVIGYSGHERGWHIPLAAFTKGAQVIEKHFTLDKSLEGNDHKVSLLPDELYELSRCLSDLSQALGIGYKRQLTQGEATNKVALSKSLFCAKAINKGEVITESHVTIMSPGNGLTPRYIKILIGGLSNRDIETGQPFHSSDLEIRQRIETINAPKHFTWCIPVRHRDVYRLYEIFNPPAIEFHLSFKDLIIDDEKFFIKPLGCEVLVHAPEQFDGDFIIDLFSDDKNIVEKSIKLLNMVFNKAKKISELMGFEGKPKVVVNCGGYTTSDFLSDIEVKRMIGNFASNLKKVDFSGCRFLAQTMPPYPWHFGGQSFHNQFTGSENIKTILNSIDVEIELCLDTSHSYMWCNYSSENFGQFIDKISQYVAHIHISDAAGESEEGLQIGDGDIDFMSILNSLSSLKNDVTLLPEIWQGHDNDGEGFRIALDLLEKQGY